MAQEQQDPEGSVDRFPSSASSKEIEGPGSPPGGRSSAAERRVRARRECTAPEQEALLSELASSGASVAEFAALHGVLPRRCTRGCVVRAPVSRCGDRGGRAGGRASARRNAGQRWRRGRSPG